MHKKNAYVVHVLTHIWTMKLTRMKLQISCYARDNMLFNGYARGQHSGYRIQVVYFMFTVIPEKLGSVLPQRDVPEIR